MTFTLVQLSLQQRPAGTLLGRHLLFRLYYRVEFTPEALFYLLYANKAAGSQRRWNPHGRVSLSASLLLHVPPCSQSTCFACDLSADSPGICAA